MSDEHDSLRFPRVVWDDFAVHAARFGFMAALFWLPPALPYLTSVGDVPTLITGVVVAMAVVAALTVPVVLVSTRYRHLGLGVVGATALFVGVAVMAATRETGVWAYPLALGGYMLGLIAVLRRVLVPPAQATPEDEMVERARRFQAKYTLTFAMLTLAANVPPLILGLTRGAGGAVPAELAAVAFWYVFALSAVLCVWCWLRFFRPFVELCLEPVFRVLYRVKGKGEKRLPPFGPCLVIANHACWFDPCFLGMILPRPITPIMTQRFYNVWFLTPLLKHVFRVIVVPETPLKRETPELELAVAALDRGEVVVIFPEGYLRRKEEVPLRRFGQGVWRILSARPDTPVVACWVEGGWGSKFSYRNGPPTQNKPMDFRRPMDVSVSGAEVVPAEVLADQMATRVHLMNRVARMRGSLGLAPLPPFESPVAGDPGAGPCEGDPESQTPAAAEPA